MELLEVAITNQILVFRTNVKDETVAKFIESHLLTLEGILEVSFDLEDWENVLRIVSNGTVEIKSIQEHIRAFGYSISELD
jgi:hypothetical protein